MSWAEVEKAGHCSSGGALQELLLVMLAKDLGSQPDKPLLLALIAGVAIIVGCVLVGSLIYSG
ncbi:hypothetical protein [Zhongshania arctica]|uniref:Uncharacterized protein n=1 Tax=Zhongshania arctica TaxID=3238302 RepID=A0ABV3TRY5_9GAMM